MKDWQLTQELFADWLDKGVPVEMIYSGIRLSDKDTKLMNDFWYDDMIMNEDEPEKYPQEQRALAERKNRDFWLDLVERYGIDTGWPFMIGTDGFVHYYRVNQEEDF